MTVEGESTRVNIPTEEENTEVTSNVWIRAALYCTVVIECMDI